MKNLIGNYEQFLQQLMNQLKNVKVDVSEMFLDHLCYRVQNLAEYGSMKSKLGEYGKLLTEEMVNGRPIATFKLTEPLRYQDRLIPLIELPAPKPNSSHKSGLEHAEFVLADTFEAFMQKHPEVSFVTKGLAKSFNPELEIEFGEMAVKFHHLSLESVIAVEQEKIPPEFCNLKTFVPHLLYRADYYGEENFVGRKIKGYENPIPVLTKMAAVKLKNAAKELEEKNLGFMVFDAYRPQRAVDDFIAWAKEAGPEYNPTYFPNVKKQDLHQEGYLAMKSSHSRGSTIDLTLYDLLTKKELDMGTIFDFFDERCHTESPLVSGEVLERRRYFVDVMKRHGFRNYRKEWWHFTMEGEPYPSIYFNFPINEFWSK